MVNLQLLILLYCLALAQITSRLKMPTFNVQALGKLQFVVFALLPFCAFGFLPFCPVALLPLPLPCSLVQLSLGGYQMKESFVVVFTFRLMCRYCRLS